MSARPIPTYCPPGLQALSPAAKHQPWRSITTLFALLALLISSGRVAAQISIAADSIKVTTTFNQASGNALPSGFRLTTALTTTTSSVVTASTTVNVASTTGILVGMAMSGTGVTAGTTVSSVNSGTQITVSVNNTIANGASLAFSNGNVPTYSSAANITSTMQNTSSGSATGQSYGYYIGTDRAIGMQSSASHPTPQSIMVQYRNNKTAVIKDLKIDFNIERYRVNSSAASVDLFYSLDGTTWTALTAGNTATSELPTAASSFTFGSPLTLTKSATITNLNLAVSGNVFFRWGFNLANANSQGVAIDNVVVTPTLVACTTPANQPTSMTFPTAGTGQITGSFSAAASAPTNYLVVRYPSGNTATNPTNGVVYTNGAALGTGTVVATGTGTSFISTGLAISTAYDFYAYSYNHSNCSGGPLYRTTSPLIGTRSTSGCPSFAATIQINPASTRVDGSVYNTLTEALLDLSGCAISQPTVIELASNYVSSGETFPLTLPAISGASSTNTITIRPAADATNLTISASSLLPATAGSIFFISDGDFWRLDGRAGGAGTTRNLTIENTDNTTAGSAAIRFINGAQNNVVTFCNVRSANIGVSSGCIAFATSTTTGNSNNTISFCQISDASTGLPNVGIGSLGAVGFANDNNQILNNNIVNIFAATGNTYGVYISDHNTNWTISGNSIYQTVSRTLASGSDRNYAPIGISPSTFSTVTGLNILGNFIGGTAPQCGGTPTTLTDVGGSGTIVLRAIFAQVGTAVPTSIQGNTIANFSISTTGTSSNHSLISAVTGAFNIGTITPNVLGSMSATGSVTLTTNNFSTSPRLCGILAGTGTPGAMTISNNQIGGLTVTNLSFGNVTLAGIHAQGAASSYTISGNTIGGTVFGSMTNNTSTVILGISLSNTTLSNTISGNTIRNLNSTALNSGATTVAGIQTFGGVNAISGNTIHSLTSASSSTGCVGIIQFSGSPGQTIIGNTIHSLESTNGLSSTSSVAGILYNGPTSGSNLIDRNFVHSLKLNTSSVAGTIYGISILSGSFPVTVQNNMVRLGLEATGADVALGYGIFGIANASSSTINHYFNTVYIGGTVASGSTSNTFAMQSTGTGTRSFLNNLLVNNRNGGTTGNHYCLSLAGTGVNPSGLTSNNNLFQASGDNGFFLSYNSTNIDNLPSMTSANGQDAGSFSCDPKLLNPTGTASTVDLHISAPPVPTLIEGNGQLVGTVTLDFDGETRSALTPTDIGADAGAFTAQLGGCIATWNGSVNTSWTNKENWTPDQIPTASSPVIIPGGMTNNPTISGTSSCLTLTMQGDASLTINASAQLRVAGQVMATGANTIVGTGKLVLNGTAAQSIIGTLNLSNLEISNATTEGVTITMSSNVILTPVAASGSGLLTLLANSKLTTNGTLTLKSNALATAMVGPIPSTATLVGNLTLERLTPGVQGWYFVGAPFKAGTKITQWSEIFPVITPKQNANVFVFTEGDTTRFQSGTRVVEGNGWKVANSITGDINPSDAPTGYRLHLSTRFNTASSSLLSVTGAPLTQNVLAPFTKTTTGFENGGWNLIANPYPCAIDWNVTKFDASNTALPMTNSVHIWNGATANYSSWTALSAGSGTGVGMSSGIIASSQAFFIKATAAGTLTFKETFKNTAATSSFRRVASQDNLVKFRLSQGTMWDEASVLFYDGADDADDQFDADNLAGSALDIATTNSTGRNLAINIMATLAGQQLIPLRVSVPAVGNATLAFEDLSRFAADYDVILIDNFAGTQTNIRTQPMVNFAVTTSAGSQGASRFMLLVKPMVTSLSATVAAQPSMTVWPNPADASQAINVSLSNFGKGLLDVRLIDVMGKTALRQQVAVNDFGTAQLSVEGITPGIYTLVAPGAHSKQIVIK